MKHAYIENKRFGAEAKETIRQAEIIINEYTEQGYVLTLRQLYYQFVSRGFIPNNQREYKRLSDVISNARLAGLISWEAIEDRTRFIRELQTFTDPAHLLRVAKNSYREDPWKMQDVYVEVWIEKDALVGVIEPICRELRIPYMSCRGFMSQSEQWQASVRFIKKDSEGKRCFIFHLGDHDPSGLDMTRDNADRLYMFHADVTVRRLALTYDQVEQYSPPPNPAKFSDPRAKGYVEEFGTESWELDALGPQVINDLIRREWANVVDYPTWEKAMKKENRGKNVVQRLIDGLGKK